jgi:hypothetical protein
MKKGTFQEITIYIPWFGEYMVHLDENEKPIRIYVYAADVKVLGKSYKSLDNPTEKILYDPQKYVKKSLNPLFLDLKEEYIQKCWQNIKKWRTKDD